MDEYEDFVEFELDLEGDNVYESLPEGKLMERLDQDDSIDVGEYAILIVDDEQDVLDSLSRVLRRAKKFKCSISTASDPGDALGMLSTDKVDLVISDFRMPTMNGVDFLTKVKDMYPQTFRVLLTGYSDMHTVKDAINRAQVHSYMEKPWDNEALQTEIYSILSKIRRFKKLKKVKKARKSKKVQTFTALEKMALSLEGKALLDGLTRTEDVESHVHTFVEKATESLPEVTNIDEKLEMLERMDLVKREPQKTTIMRCPGCNSYDLRMEMACPFCSSTDVNKEDVIEHYTCSHTDSARKFAKKGGLECPSCGKGLRQIGVDYRKIGNWVKCTGCGEFSGEANVNLACNDCKEIHRTNDVLWERPMRIVPDTRKIAEFSMVTDVISGIITALERRGATFARRAEGGEGKKHTFDLIVFGQGYSNPALLADIAANEKGLFFSEINSIATKDVDLSCGKRMFIAIPSMSADSKKLCDSKGVEYIELRDGEAATEFFMKAKFCEK